MGISADTIKIKKADNEIILTYNIYYKIKKIQIFGTKFVENNKNICKIIYKNKKYELQSFFDVQKFNIKNNILKIKLIGVSKITNMSYMFYNCYSLINISDLSKLNTSNVTNMEYMFAGCISLPSLPDISKWNTSKLSSVNNIFYHCSALNNIPDISLWNINNVTNLSYIFGNLEIAIHYYIYQIYRNGILQM